jgi:ATP-dependent RNA helicase DDX24/MAK5
LVCQVDHVIHYDLPRSLEVFVHRSGRTARAQLNGLSFSIVSPKDERMHQEVCRSLLGGEAMAAFPIDLVKLGGARERVSTAGRIVRYELEEARRQSTESWVLKSAREADLTIDDDMLAEEQATSEKDRQRAMQVARDKERLQQLLTQPLVVGAS